METTTHISPALGPALHAAGLRLALPPGKWTPRYVHATPKGVRVAKGARPIALPGFEALDMFVARSSDGHGHTVTERTTGRRIGWGETEEAAIAAALDILTYLTPQEIAEGLERHKLAEHVTGRAGEGQAAGRVGRLAVPLRALGPAGREGDDHSACSRAASLASISTSACSCAAARNKAN